MKKKFGVIKFVAGVVILPLILFFSFVSLKNNGFFNIDQIEIVLESVPENPIYLQPLVKKADEYLEKFRGQSLTDLNLPELSRKLNSESWIQEVSISRRFPSRIRVVIEPKAIQLLLMSRVGKLIPVVADGSLLEPIELKQAPSVPILVGDTFNENLEMRKKSVAAVQAIPAEGSFSRRSISEIKYDNKEGFWMTLVHDGIKVKMGEDQMSLKSSRVSQVLDYMGAHDFQARVIDANLSKKVLVRLRKDP